MPKHPDQLIQGSFIEDVLLVYRTLGRMSVKFSKDDPEFATSIAKLCADFHSIARDLIQKRAGVVEHYLNRKTS